MKYIDQLLRQVQWLLRSLDIHPLVFAAGAIFCIFFPRFFLLALFGFGAYWVARNVWVKPARRPRQGGKRRHQ